VLSGQLHAPAVLRPGKEAGYPLKLRPGRSKSRCGRFGEDKNLFPAGFRTADRPARGLVNILGCPGSVASSGTVMSKF
jgi:hypothetical protein